MHFRSRKIKETEGDGTKENSPKMELPQNEGKKLKSKRNGSRQEQLTYRIVAGKGGSADMWRIIIRFVEIVSNSNRRSIFKNVSGIKGKMNGRTKAKEICGIGDKISSR